MDKDVILGLVFLCFGGFLLFIVLPRAFMTGGILGYGICLVVLSLFGWLFEWFRAAIAAACISGGIGFVVLSITDSESFLLIIGSVLVVLLGFYLASTLRDDDRGY